MITSKTGPYIWENVGKVGISTENAPSMIVMHKNIENMLKETFH